MRYVNVCMDQLDQPMISKLQYCTLFKLKGHLYYFLLFTMFSCSCSQD